jgi:CheY-like chemotaxis protein
MAQTKILMADNDLDFLDTRREFLEKEGYKVVTASSPLEAQEKLQQGDVDFAIIDIRLLDDDDEKDVSGLELAKNAEHSLPIIILTGYPVVVEYVRQALQFQAKGIALAQYFLAKEEGPKALLTAIRSTLENAHEQKAALAENAVVIDKTQARMFWGKRWRSTVSSVIILLALGAGIAATIYGDPRWLIGTVALAVLAVGFAGAPD